MDSSPKTGTHINSVTLSRVSWMLHHLHKLLISFHKKNSKILPTILIWICKSNTKWCNIRFRTQTLFLLNMHYQSPTRNLRWLDLFNFTLFNQILKSYISVHLCQDWDLTLREQEYIYIYIYIYTYILITTNFTD